MQDASMFGWPFRSIFLWCRKRKREKKGTERSKGCVFGERSALGEHHLWLIYSCASVWHRPRGDSCDENKEKWKHKAKEGAREPTPSFLLPNMSTSPHKDPAIIQYRSIQIHAHISKKKKTSLQSALLLILFPHKNKSITENCFACLQHSYIFYYKSRK